MGKKGNWLSTIKRVLLPSCNGKPVNGLKKISKEKKKGGGKLRHGKTKSFIPLFRGPSSIEKILGEVDQQKLLIRPPTPVEQPKTPALVLPGAASPKAASPEAASPKAGSPQAAISPRAASSGAVHHHTEVSRRPEPSERYSHVSAIKIQAAYRGYKARRSFRALRGLVRLEEVVRGQNVKRQTMTALKTMQQLVRVQTQIQSRRMQMLENRTIQQQACRTDKDLQSTLSKWTVNQSEAGLREEWDDSSLTKEEREARLQRKVEAIIKKERAMTYACSHKLWKGAPRSAQTSVTDIRSGGFPWWWNWLDHQLLPANAPESQTTDSFHQTPPRSTLERKPSPRLSLGNYKQQNMNPLESQTVDSFHLTPPRSTFERKLSPRPSLGIYKLQNTHIDALEALTPRSTRSAAPARTKYLYTPPNRTPTSSSITTKYSKPKNSAAFDLSLKDDESLTSCPPFSVPNYMSPTVSAKAKMRGNRNSKDQFPGTPPGGDPRKRFSFPLTPDNGTFKWNKGSSKDSNSHGVLEKHQSLKSAGDADSAISMPASVGRKPLNRFV